MRVVLTGATSFLGKNLLKSILEHGHECYAIVRPESLSKLKLIENHPKLNIVSSDVANVEEWKKQIVECDIFYHLSWSGVGAIGRSDPIIQEGNVKVALECMRAAGDLNCKRFLFAGSQAEYGPTNDLIDELYPCKPMIEYGKGKLQVYELCSELAKTINMEYVHCRIFSVYGDGDHPWTLVSQCIDSFCSEKTIDLSSCEQLWNFLHIDDAVHMLRLLGMCELHSDDTRYNIASTDTRPLKDFVNEIWSLCGNKGTPNFGGRVGAIEKEYGINPCVDKLLNTIHFSPQITFEQGISSLLLNKKENGI